MATINERQSKVQRRQFTHCIWTKMAPVLKKCKSGADARSTKHQSNTAIISNMEAALSLRYVQGWLRSSGQSVSPLRV